MHEPWRSIVPLSSRLKDVRASGEVVQKQNTTYYGADARAGKMTMNLQKYGKKEEVGVENKKK